MLRFLSIPQVCKQSIIGRHLQILMFTIPSLAITFNFPAANSTLAMHVPWNHEESFSVQPAYSENSLPLKLHTGRAPGDTRLPQLHVYLDPMCQYELQVQYALPDTFGQVSAELNGFHHYLMPNFKRSIC